MTSEAETQPAAATNASDRMGWVLLLCWAMATGASLGSLFFSQVMELPPCSLCWYQRVFMFPLALVLLVGVFTGDRGVTRYALPLSIGGWLVALWHVLLHMGIVPESATPCSQGVSCADVQLELFGFASIPVMSFAAFTAITAGLLVAKRQSNP